MFCLFVFIKFLKINYHIGHFLTGFIGVPSGHLKASENDLKFASGPIVLKKGGEKYFILKKVYYFLRNIVK